MLVTGFDIIFFWVARMVMMTTYFTGKVPFREVYINAIVRDAEGQKMSKSKGNTLDPLDLIDGIDARRRWCGNRTSVAADSAEAARSREAHPQGISRRHPRVRRRRAALHVRVAGHVGRTINFDLKRCEGYRNFCNKLWNATRFVLMNCEGNAVAADTAPAYRPPMAEHWIVSRLRATHRRNRGAFRRCTVSTSSPRRCTSSSGTNTATGSSNSRSRRSPGEDKAAARVDAGTRCCSCSKRVLRALHPIMPFITEEIWQAVAPLLALRETQRHAAQLSARDRSAADDAAASTEMEWLRALLSQLRRIRSEMNIEPKKPIPLLYANGNASDRSRAAKFAAQIAFIARTESQRWLEADEAEPVAAAVIVGEMKVLIPLAGLIDLGAEKARVEKEIKRLEGEMAKSSAKLANFGPKTPPAVVEQEKQRIAEFTTTLNGLREQAGKLAGA